MKIIKIFKSLLVTSLILTTLKANNNLLESQPEIIFNFEKLVKSQKNLALQVEFNKAVLLLSKKEYKESIKIFEKTVSIIEIPSFLNMGIAYYKLNSIDKAVIYLNKIYENKSNVQSNTFSYMSACYYLYEISKDEKYLETIIKVSRKFKNLSEHSKRMLADTYIILKKYEEALTVLDSMDYAMDLKKALIYLKLNNHIKADIYLKKAKEVAVNSKTLEHITWFMIYSDLKSNNLEQLFENLDNLNEIKSTFKSNLELPLEIYFNKNKFTPKQYLESLISFSDDRKIDFMFYFAPFIFSDLQEVIYDSSKGFIFNSEDNIQNLEEMVEYNSKFLEIVKEDPIIRVIKLEKLIKKDTKSYVYYNLALSYTQINDFYNAYKYFNKAYKLNPGNKLYAVMTLITAKKIDSKVKDKEYMESIIKSKNGLYNYFGKELYKYFLNPEYKTEVEALNYKDTIFFKAIDYLKVLDAKEDIQNHTLFSEYKKDPLIYLMRLVHRKKDESDLSYYSRLQDNVPLKFNNNFLEGPLIITKYYIDMLKALGLFSKADLKIDGKKSPSYLKTKVLRDLHFNASDESIKTLEYLQKEYNLEDKYTMYLMVASLLESGRYNDASIQISLIKALLNDKESSFLTGVQLIQDLKIISAKEYIKEPFIDSLIDFKLVGFDEYLESL
ncbi:MAG: tetratricopeptide repeat protein [Poseidonibacter sp.]|uniref:tetratricopeptide repeat protein n=1 Tax=Poseidonibacter sp. TaxID=2321188 RepID=UPI00359D8F07